MSDSSTDGESSSQGQVTSPTKVADELPFVDKVNYLHANFPTYTKEVSLVHNFYLLASFQPEISISVFLPKSMC